MGSGAGALLTVLADEPRNVVVGVDVPDRLDDVSGPVTAAPGGQDGGLEPGGRLLERLRGVGQLLPRVVIHGSQCLTVLNYGHDPIIHDSFVV